MSTICTCSNSGVSTGFACNYSAGCPNTFSTEPPKVKIGWPEPEPIIVMDKAHATSRAATVVMFLGELIAKLSNGATDGLIITTMRNAMDHWEPLLAALCIQPMPKMVIEKGLVFENVHMFNYTYQVLAINEGKAQLLIGHNFRLADKWTIEMPVREMEEVFASGKFHLPKTNKDASEQ